MKITSADLRRLGPALLLGLGLALVGLAAAYLGSQRAQDAAQGRQQAELQLKQIQARLAKAEEEETEIRQKGELYDILRQRGFFAPENRLEWIELLRQHKARLGIPLLHYEFTPQRPLEGMENLFLASAMELQLGLNHEQELDELLKGIASQSPALVRIRDCELARAPGRPTPPIPGPNLTAHCRLDWISGRPAGAQP